MKSVFGLRMKFSGKNVLKRRFGLKKKRFKKEVLAKKNLKMMLGIKRFENTILSGK